MLEIVLTLKATLRHSWLAGCRCFRWGVVESGGGSFGYDFRVSEVLISQTPEPINRVFTIRLRSDETKESFFSDAEYLAIKRAVVQKEQNAVA